MKYLTKLYICTLNIPCYSEKANLLKCTEVSKQFGGLQALKKVDLIVNSNEITGLLWIMALSVILIGAWAFLSIDKKEWYHLKEKVKSYI